MGATTAQLQCMELDGEQIERLDNLDQYARVALWLYRSISRERTAIRDLMARRNGAE